jgi:arabinofuranosyltransferase
MSLRRFLTPQTIVFILSFVARIIPGPRTIDDAFITFRYAQNMLSGHGLVYNPGEAVLGTTTPVYALLMTGLGLLAGGPHAPFPAIAVIANALSDSLTCWLLVKLGETLGHRRAGLSAAIVWAIAPWSVTFAIGGMETSLFVLLIVSTFYLHSTNRPIWAALTASFCLLTRPDALLFIIPLVIERLRQIAIHRHGVLRSPRATLIEISAFCLPAASWAVIGFMIYGNPIPNSILAKVAAYRLPSDAALTRLLQHYGTPFLGQEILGNWWIGAGFLIFLTLYLSGAVGSLRKTPRAWPLFVFPWVYFIVFAIANPLIFRWYLTPPLPIYFLGIFIGIERIGEHWKHPVLLIIATSLALTSTMFGWTLHPDHGPENPAPKMAYIELELLYQKAARNLKERIEPDQILAAGDIGALGYYTGAHMLDTIGLITPQSLSFYPIPSSEYVINYAIPADLILETEPDYFVTLEVYIRNTLLADERFEQRYLLLERYQTDIYGSRGMLIYQRVPLQ